MGDVGETFKAYNESMKLKKMNNLLSSTDMLNKKGIKFESKNNGVHLIVNHNSKVADFWPSTGKFNIRGESGYQRGINRLLNKLGAK